MAGHRGRETVARTMQECDAEQVHVFKKWLLGRSTCSTEVLLKRH